jgi:hypothetical protein
LPSYAPGFILSRWVRANSHKPFRFNQSVRTSVGRGYSGCAAVGLTSAAHRVWRRVFARFPICGDDDGWGFATSAADRPLRHASPQKTSNRMLNFTFIMYSSQFKTCSGFCNDDLHDRHPLSVARAHSFRPLRLPHYPKLPAFTIMGG